jgi:hypothetical protein
MVEKDTTLYGVGGKMNKISKGQELAIIAKYKETYSIRKTQEALKVSNNAVRRVIKTCGDFKKINYRNYGLKEFVPQEIQKDTITRGIVKASQTGIFHLWVETEPMRLWSHSNDKQLSDFRRTARLRKLAQEGDTHRFKIYENLGRNAPPYGIAFGDSWQAKLTTQTCTIKVKLTGTDPLSMIDHANDMVIEKAQEIHKRFGDLFRVNIGGNSPHLRFKTSQGEFGLMSKEIHQRLKIMGFRAYSDGFNAVYIDRTPGKGLEMQGLDGSTFCNNFGELTMWLAGGHKIDELVTKNELFQAFGIYTENTLRPVVNNAQQQTLNMWATNKDKDENRPNYFG